jgi:DNA repair exonuclease SbcCD ATPase subunit
MPDDVSIYAIALEWLRVPSYLLPGVIFVLVLLGLLLLRSSRLANLKSKTKAAEEARQRVAQIEQHLESALREVVSACPNPEWEPPDSRQGTKISPKGTIDMQVDAQSAELIAELARICDAHLPEYRKQVLAIENRIRSFAQQRRELLSRRDTVFHLESELAALNASELEAIARYGTGHGWGSTFDDPMLVPMERRAAAAREGQYIAENARRDHGVISDALGRLASQLAEA